MSVFVASLSVNGSANSTRQSFSNSKMSGVVTMETRVSAVELKDVYRSYGLGKSKVAVLRACNMDVPKGAM